MVPTISVILPTFRRPQLLKVALASLARSEGCAPTEVEVIVVDNNSGDVTPTVVSDIARDFPFPLRYVLEKVQGVSVARNRGAAEARGALFVYMDEDQQIHPGYLARVPQTYVETKADCFGGWLGYVGAEKFPSWLWTVIGRVGQRDFGPQVRSLGIRDGRLAGGNMILPREVFARFGGFRTDVGPNGKNTTYGEDLDLQDRILAAGGTVFYDPALRQNHYLDPERMKRSYYLSRAFQAGRGEYRLHRNEWAAAARLFGIPLFLWRRTVSAGLQAIARGLSKPEQSFNFLCRFLSDVGQCREAFALRGNPKLISINPAS